MASDRRLDLRVFLPDPATPKRAIVDHRQTWTADGTGAFERTEYVYEPLDRLATPGGPPMVSVRHVGGTVAVPAGVARCTPYLPPGGGPTILVRAPYRLPAFPGPGGADPGVHGLRDGHDRAPGAGRLDVHR